MLDEMTPTLQPGSDSTQVQILRSAWERGEFSDLAEPIQAAKTPKQAADLVISEQYYRWKHGDHRRIESYVQSYPSLRANPAALVEMLRAELVLRREFQETPKASDYETSFPEISSQIRALLDSRDPEPVEATLGAADADLWKPTGKSLAPDAPQISGYELLEELGRGGMGVVFRAKQLLADRMVALKIIRPDSLALLDPVSRAGVIRRFGAEARAAAKLNNDHIVTVYDIGECRGFHFYTMKLVEGPSLSSLLREKPLDDRSAARYCREAALGVHAAHELGILHRDLKPSNVMLDRVTGRALVADFGLAKIASEGREQLTHSGDVVGTPAYMPPEQAKDSSTVTAQSDVYSLGATLYHAITGRPPFQAASLGEILRQIADEEPIAPRRMNPRINRDLETICLKAMQKAPAQRYATAKEFADELGRFLEGRPILARPVSKFEAFRRWCNRNPHLAGAIGTATGLALVALIAIIYGYVQTSFALASSKRRLEKSLSLVDELFTKVSEDALFEEPGMQAVRKQLLQRARTHYEELLADSGNLPIAQEELAAAHYRFGKISLELGDFAIAQTELAAAEGDQRRQLSAAPDNQKRKLALAETLIATADVKQRSQDYSMLTALYSEALRLRTEAAEKEPGDIELQRKAASARMNFGAALQADGNNVSALKEMEQAQRTRLELLERDRSHFKIREDFAKGAYNLATVLLADETAESKVRALKELELAGKTLEGLIVEQPRMQSLRSNLAKTLRMKASKEDAADSDYARAAELNSELLKANPDVVELRMEAGRLQLDRGNYYIKLRRPEEAITTYAQCEETLKDLAEKKGDASEIVAICLCERGKAEISLERNSAAVASLERSLGWWNVLLNQTKDDAFLRESKAEVEKLIAAINAAAAPPKEMK